MTHPSHIVLDRSFALRYHHRITKKKALFALPAIFLFASSCTLPTDPRGNTPAIITFFGRGTDTAFVGISNTITAAAFDIGGDAVSFSYRVLSGGGTVTGSSSNALYTPLSTGEKTLEVTAVDRGGAASKRTVTVDAYDPSRWVTVTPSASFSGREGHASVVFNDRIWVIGGYNGAAALSDVWYSSDGANWTQATPAAFPVRAHHTALSFNGRLWVIGGSNGGALSDVWYSSDGANWTQATAAAAFGGRFLHGSAVFLGKMWLTAGQTIASDFGDVWSSYDGVTWTFAADSFMLSRRAHATAVWNGRLYIIGGEDRLANDFADFMASRDGIVWENVSGGFGATIAGHAALDFDGYLWLVGGTFDLQSGMFFNYCIGTPDGGAGFLYGRVSERWYHSAVAYRNKIWIIGGFTNTAQRANDVQRFE